MRKRYLKISLVILFIVMFCWGCRALLSFLFPLGFEGQPDVTLERDEYYAMDSQTILQDLAQGRPIRLTLLPEEPEPPTYAPPLRWTQADYLRVADAAFFTVWGESIANWKLEGIWSRIDCEDMESGFQWMGFRFFKVIRREGVTILAERSLYLHPRENLIKVLGFETSPVSPLEKFSEIKVEEIIPAEAALRIAEENGGRQARLDINRCTISTDIIAGSNHDNWQVWYTSDRNFFFMEIDEKSGHIIGFWKE